MLNFYGVNDGKGIEVFIDGAEISRDATKQSWRLSVGEPRITIGRYLINDPQDQESTVIVDADELVFFNQNLSPVQVQVLSGSVPRCPNRCQNGGTYELGLISYGCVCAEGFYGLYCESEVEESTTGSTTFKNSSPCCEINI